MKGFQQYNTILDNSTALDFAIRQRLKEVNVGDLVVVKAVYPDQKTVDVQPLVDIVDGAGNSIEKTTVFNIPYLWCARFGVNAIITAPAVGDIGQVLYNSRDTTNVRKNKAPAVPQTNRMFNASDCVYIGGIPELNQAPTRMIEFTDEGIKITPNTKLTIDGDVEINGNMTQTGDYSLTGKLEQTGDFTSTGTVTGQTDVIAGTISGKGHTHTSTQAGQPTSSPNA